MPGSDGPHVLLTGEAIDGLVRAIAQMSSADLGPYAIVGGIAVAARLGQAHRVTRDVDTVVDQDHLPAAIAVLRALPSATDDPAGGPHRILLQGTMVEVMEVGLMPEADDLGLLPERQRLFVTAHSWALATATQSTLVTVGPDSARATAPFATPAALVAMKLHAIQDRSGDGQAKRAGDAWDLHQLLSFHNRRGEISGALRTGPDPLRLAVQAAAQRVLVDGAARTRAWLRTAGGAQSGVSAAEITRLGEELVEGLS
jgi:hypothetical protein